MYSLASTDSHWMVTGWTAFGFLHIFGYLIEIDVHRSPRDAHFAVMLGVHEAQHFLSLLSSDGQASLSGTHKHIVLAPDSDCYVLTIGVVKPLYGLLYGRH